MGGACWQWWHWCERQATFQVALLSCLQTKWKVTRSHHLLKSVDYDQGTFNSDCHITILTKQKAWISKVRPAEKTVFLLQHDYAKPHTNLETMEHAAKSGWTVLPHPTYSPDLASSDFHLFRQMKDGLHGQHFPDSDTLITAVRKWITSDGAVLYRHRMQALVCRQWWWLCGIISVL